MTRRILKAGLGLALLGGITGALALFPNAVGARALQSAPGNTALSPIHQQASAMAIPLASRHFNLALGRSSIAGHARSLPRRGTTMHRAYHAARTTTGTSYTTQYRAVTGTAYRGRYLRTYGRTYSARNGTATHSCPHMGATSSTSSTSSTGY